MLGLTATRNIQARLPYQSPSTVDAAALTFFAELESQSIDHDAPLFAESVPAVLSFDMDVADGCVDADSWMDAPRSTTDPTPSLV